MGVKSPMVASIFEDNEEGYCASAVWTIPGGRSQEITARRIQRRAGSVEHSCQRVSRVHASQPVRSLHKACEAVFGQMALVLWRANAQHRNHGPDDSTVRHREEETNARSRERRSRNATVNRDLASLKHMLHKAEIWGYVEISPGRRVE